MSAILQLVIVVVALAWSLGFMLRRQFPAITRTLQQHLASVSHAQGWSALGRWLQPAEKTAAGCDNGCSSCSPACASDKTAAATEQPAQWRQPPASGGCH